MPSPSVECPHASRCSGCGLIDRPYAEHLTLKAELLRRELTRYPELHALETTATVGAEPISGYRLRAKLVVSGRSLGLYARGGHEVVDIPECRVVTARILRVTAAVRRALPLPFQLDAVDLREVDAGVLVTWIVPEGTPTPPLLEAARSLQREEPCVLGVAVSERPRASPRVLGGAPEPLLGARSAEQRLSAKEPFFEASFGSFVQAHGAQASRLYAHIRALLEAELGGLRARPVLELYAGAGALALRLAEAGARVTAVESFEPAASSITRAAKAQALPLRALALSAEKALLHELAGAAAVVVDPPRRGLSPRVREAIGAQRPKVLVYVSCEPATLARDLAHLSWLGLSARSAVPFDMIPLSESVEAVVALTPASPPEPRILHSTPLFIALEKPAHLPLSGPHGLSALVRRLQGLEHARPLMPLDAEASGVCLYARDPAAEATLRPHLARATIHTLALLRGIARAKGHVTRPVGPQSNPREAYTRYRRERVVGTHSLIAAETELADLPQAPRHFASIGHPVLGDAQSGHAPSNRYFFERHGLDRAFLHNAALLLEHPEGSARIESPLAPDLVAVLESLERPESAKLLSTGE